MVGAGFAMLALALLALFYGLGEMLDSRARWLKIYPYAMVLPYAAAMAGWVMTEVGRVPWIVYGLMKIEQGVTPTLDVFSASLTLVVFTLVYAVLLVLGGRLFLKFAFTGHSVPEPVKSAATR